MASLVYSILHILANTVGHVEKLYIAHSILQRHQLQKNALVNHTNQTLLR